MIGLVLLVALLLGLTPFLVSPLAGGCYAELWVLDKLKRLWHALKKRKLFIEITAKFPWQNGQRGNSSV